MNLTKFIKIMFILDELFGFEGHHQSIKTKVGSFIRCVVDNVV